MTTPVPAHAPTTPPRRDRVRGVFVAGTDTGVGKTVVSTQWVRSARRLGRRLAVMKPIASGASLTADGWRNDDAVALIEATGADPRDAAIYARVNPYCFGPPISPHLAARDAGVRIDVDALVSGAYALARGHDALVVEGAGGWLAPIDDDRTMADLAIALGWPVLLVVGLRLGCLNHAALTHDAIVAAGLPVVGWVANTIDPDFARREDNIAALSQRLGAPPLTRFAHAPPGTQAEPTDPDWGNRLVDVLG